MSRHFDELLDKSIDIWFAEDIGDGDHTTLSTIPEKATGEAVLLSKDTGIIAGIDIASRIYKKFDPGLRLKELVPDGSRIKPGDIIFNVSGSVRSILQTERIILNVVQRMSGVATQTLEYVTMLDGFHSRVLDTRKTTPGMRYAEKEAVRLGGGLNHRFGLFDMILIKDNHIDFAGGISNAIRQATEYIKLHGHKMKVEVEARNLSDVDEILHAGGVDRILLDNFTPQLTTTALSMIAGRLETESSGGITKENMRTYAATGVDFISVGALTHQIKSLDISLKATF